MTTVNFRKGLVLAVIVLFIGAGVVPNISGLKVSNSPPDVQWTSFFDEYFIQSSTCVRQTSDNGYIVAGYYVVEDYNGGGILIKYNNEGNRLWYHTYNIGDFNSIDTTHDGGFIGCASGSFISGPFNIIKIDSGGNTQWSKWIIANPDSDWESLRQIHPTNDGGYILAGTAFKYSPDDNDMFFIKLDSNGNKIWTKIYDNGPGDRGYSARQTSDGGYIFGGSTYESGKAGNWVIKTDSNGNTQWEKIFWESQDANDIRQTSDGGYIMAGWFLIIKTDSNGNKQWDYNPDGEGYYCIEETSDGGFVSCGSNDDDCSDACLIKLDSDGNLKWEKRVDYNGMDVLVWIHQTYDGGYIASGLTANQDFTDTKILTIKFSPDNGENHDIIIDKINGGFRVSADITNNGTNTATDVPWSIDLDGGLIITGSHSEGVIDELAPGTTKTIRQSTLYGIGRTTITVTAGGATKQATAFILGPFVLRVEEIS